MVIIFTQSCLRTQIRESNVGWVGYRLGLKTKAGGKWQFLCKKLYIVGSLKETIEVNIRK